MVDSPRIDDWWWCDERFRPDGVLSPNGKPVVWSRGDGWVTAGHVKTLKALPASQANVAEYRSSLTQLVSSLRPIQRTDGFWNVNLTDPQHLPGPETSATAFFAYATAYTVRASLLPSATYLPLTALTS